MEWLGRKRMTDCVISILMPVYNTPEIFLRKSIESILRQTFKKFEFISEILGGKLFG